MGQAYSTVLIEVNIKRNPQHYVWGVFVPLSLIMVSSLLIFFSEKPINDDQLEYLSTLLLSIIAVRWSMSDKMPKIPYLSWMDYFFLGCSSMIFVLMLYCSTSGWTHRYLISFVAAPLALIATLYWLNAYLRNHNRENHDDYKPNELLAVKSHNH